MKKFIKIFKKIYSKKRFGFGNNWLRFSENNIDQNIDFAKKSLEGLLNLENYEGKTFLDIGCGSGIVSLAARRMGMEVYSFDYDSNSVKSCQRLKKRYLPNDKNWAIEKGSILNKEYLEKIGKFDIVYSWGVLHHTGKLWESLENLSILLKNNKDSVLALAIYNDQGLKSRIWWIIKFLYNTNFILKLIIKIIFLPIYFLIYIFLGLKIYGEPFKYFSEYKKKRGMHPYYDWIDWLGGFPFEVSTFKKIVSFFKSRQMKLINSTRTNSLGCNEFVFCFENKT